MNSFFKHTIRPRLGFIPFYLTWLVLQFSKVISKKRRHPARINAFSKLCIEAGVRGWDSIEFKELYLSAIEYLQLSQVNKIVIEPHVSYLKQVKIALDQHRPTHYFYDPRTGSQNKHRAIWEAFRVAWMLNYNGVIPIVLLTDVSVRTWRFQSAIVTALKGTVIAFMAPHMVSPIFPHRRLFGPSLMPLSELTLNLLNRAINNKVNLTINKAVFIGSLYEPRTTILNEIAEGLQEQNLTLEVRGRVLGAKRVPDSMYWEALINSPIIITTAGQVETDETDWTWIPQLVYRYIEAMACGTLLVAPKVPGILRYFSPGEHFASFDSSSDAVNVIQYYLTHENERMILADRGRKRARDLISSRSFWTCIDITLAKDSLT